MSKSTIRVLLAKPGLDSHDRGILVVAAALRDAGMEVIYLGLHMKPEQIAQAAVQEDVDIVGLSFLTDAHCVLAPRVVQELEKRGAKHIPVVVGGFIQPEDVTLLKEAGISEVLGIGAKLETIVNVMKQWAQKARERRLK